jgi:hypothetical protein
MAAAGRTAAAPSSAAASGLHGPVPDLLFGAGLAYVLTIPLLLYAARHGISTWSATVTAALALFVSGPHYGATLLRVYERRADRAKYVLFALYATLVLAAAVAFGLRSVWIGSLIVTLYVTWSPWHFAGQNYGIALMFLRRRGVEVEPRFKRWFYLSFVLSFLLAILSIHSAASSLVFAQGASNYRVYQILRAGIPMEVVAWVAPVVGGLYLLSLGAAARLVLRRGSPRDLLEPALLVLTQALWFALPAFGAMTGAYQMLGLAFAPIWISTAHAIQYLWVTSYYAKRSSPAVPAGTFLLKAALAGGLLMVLPAVLFAPPLLGGQVIHFAEAAVLVFAGVNLHHFVLDGAVWKLRDGRVASVLLRTDPNAAGQPADADRPGWLRPALLGAGALCLALAVYSSVAFWIVRSPTAPLAEVERAHRVLTWLGRGDPQGCHQLAERHLQLGMLDEAIDDYRSCLHIVRDQMRTQPSSELTQRLARLLLLVRSADPASRDEAVRLAVYATRADPEDLRAFELLADAHAASGDLREAQQATRRAIEVARATGAEDRAASLEQRLAHLDPVSLSAGRRPAARRPD